jgi:hypothetical protein
VFVTRPSSLGRLGCASRDRAQQAAEDYGMHR